MTALLSIVHCAVAVKALLEVVKAVCYKSKVPDITKGAIPALSFSLADSAIPEKQKGGEL